MDAEILAPASMASLGQMGQEGVCLSCFRETQEVDRTPASGQKRKRLNHKDPVATWKVKLSIREKSKNWCDCRELER